MKTFTETDLIWEANTLISEGENTEYDRALIELIMGMGCAEGKTYDETDEMIRNISKTSKS